MCVWACVGVWASMPPPLPLFVFIFLVVSHFAFCFLLSSPPFFLFPLALLGSLTLEVHEYVPKLVEVVSLLPPPSLPLFVSCARNTSVPVLVDRTLALPLSPPSRVRSCGSLCT